MSDVKNIGAELLDHLGLKPWQAMAIQDKISAPAFIKVFVFDPSVDVASFSSVSTWHSVPVTFEKSAPPLLH
ncbi:hypothetical protein ACYQR9_10670 [Methylobacterium sp. CM6241]